MATIDWLLSVSKQNESLWLEFGDDERVVELWHLMSHVNHHVVED